MANFKSTEYTNETAAPQTFSKSNAMGPVIRKDFTFVVPAGTAASDTVQLVSIPVGCKFLGGKYFQDLLGNNIQIGDGITAAAYLASTVVTSAGGQTFGDTLALLWGTILSVATVITATVTVGGWTAGKTLTGYVEYRLP